MNKRLKLLLKSVIVISFFGYSVGKACTIADISGSWIFTYSGQNFTVVLQPDGSILGVPKSELSWTVTGNKYREYENDFCRSGEPIISQDATLNAECTFMSGSNYDLYDGPASNTPGDTNIVCIHDGSIPFTASKIQDHIDPYYGPWEDNRTLSSCNSDCVKRVEQTRTCIGGTHCVGPALRIVTRTCEPGEAMCPLDLPNIAPIISLLLLSHLSSDACTFNTLGDCVPTCTTLQQQEERMGDGFCDT